MKNISKIAASLLAVGALTSGLNAAQTTGTVDVTANVVAALTLENAAALDFGDVVSGNSKEIAAIADCGDNGTTDNGKVEIKNATADQEVKITVTYPHQDDDTANPIALGDTTTDGANMQIEDSPTISLCLDETGSPDTSSLTEGVQSDTIALKADDGDNKNWIYMAGTATGKDINGNDTDPQALSDTIDVVIDY